MKLQIFRTKKFLKWTLFKLVQQQSPWNILLKKDENCYPQVFLKECSCIEKLILHGIDDFESSSDDSDEEQIKAVRVIYFSERHFENVVFERAILKMYFMTE